MIAPPRVRLGVALVAAAALSLSGCAAASATGRASTTPASASAFPPPAGPAKPAIPATGAYLGAWVNPLGAKDGQAEPGQAEIAQLPAFNALIGTHVQVLHVFSGFSIPLPTKTLGQIEANGATPLLDWGCDDVAAVAAGTDDTIIRTYADGLKAFAHPVFLRWYWEMNHLDHHSDCGAGASPTGFVAAWRHIWTIFQQEHATNAAFVWCPGGNSNTAAFYPGDRFVDWIGDDHFDDQGAPTTGTAAVRNVFGAFYTQWSGRGKPMMIGATAAAPTDQAGYLQGLQAALPTTYPALKALVYFDAPGDNGKGPWNLQNSGAAAFKALAADPYFSFERHN